MSRTSSVGSNVGFSLRTYLGTYHSYLGRFSGILFFVDIDTYIVSTVTKSKIVTISEECPFKEKPTFQNKRQ